MELTYTIKKRLLIHVLEDIYSYEEAEKNSRLNEQYKCNLTLFLRSHSNIINTTTTLNLKYLVLFYRLHCRGQMHPVSCVKLPANDT
jgi:hypothetical protein